jgi:tRNA-binding EMAP/Myf-like protein
MQVCAGLKGKYESAELVGRSVVVLMNLKPAEFKVRLCARLVCVYVCVCMCRTCGA